LNEQQSKQIGYHSKKLNVKEISQSIVDTWQRYCSLRIFGI